MLASLLPGLRDLRTPLAVGYLWLMCAWLWFHDALPRRATASGPVADLYALNEILPPATFLAALTFCAYFLGSIVELHVAEARWLDPIRPNRASWEAVADRFRIRLDEGETWTAERLAAGVAVWHRAAPARTTKSMTLLVNLSVDEAEQHLLDSGPGARATQLAWRASMEAAVQAASAHAVAQGQDPPVRESPTFLGGPGVWTQVTLSPFWSTQHVYWNNSPEGTALIDWRGRQLPLQDATVRQLSALALAALYALRDELPDLATRLLIERPEVFDRYDRLLAEASIRINMFLPVTALVATLALQAHWLWWLGLAAGGALLAQGLVLRSRALAVVMDSVAMRLIESPTTTAVEGAQPSAGGPEDPRTRYGTATR
ncbi:hypothetical protein [Streptomyces sp. VRA16 Mangrove soil]|uniref:hypothetical protein n=1 Tax=Streptomyces sp. VRA16 Mangrove soil TaxID=2817434 RepID=UPI001A9E2028|nr:hypothetical protein [Streptomyces sp. VRA16 Mangrove soil]MBO1336870.1 hypothetical protein [Streptomyces sp. VRA16 Mangrove soil]